MCGLKIDEFWDMTLWEISDFMHAKHTQKKEEINDLFVQAQAISSRVNYFFSDAKKRSESDILQPWDIYPEVFKDEREAFTEAKRQHELMDMVEKRTARMRAINDSRYEVIDLQEDIEQ